MTGENSMKELLSCVSAIVILSVILSAAGLSLKRRVPLSLTVLGYVPLIALLLLMDLLVPLGPYTHGKFPFACLLFFLPFYGLYSGALPRKLFLFLIHLTAGFAIGWISALSAKYIFALQEEAYEAVRLGMLLLIGSLYLYWVNVKGKRTINGLLTRGDGWEWPAYAFGLCLGCVLLTMVFDPSVNRTQLFFGLVLVFIAWNAAVLILAVLAARAAAQTSFDLELARHIIEAATAQAGEITSMVETARILRHDCKHHLHVAQILLETGKIQEAREYLLAFGTKCDEGVLQMYCSDPCVNALLNGYRKRSLDSGIAFSAVVELPENPHMDSFELCTLLGNLLENALEACRKAPEGQRRITLKGAPQGNQLLISVNNTFDGTVLKEEDHIVSRKGASGGLGIRSIRTIAGRHHGEYVPEWNGNTFTASVMLRL
jgi:signal transduction histidine kinase